MVYADTSFLVSAYIEDEHSEAADELLLSKPRFCFTPLHFAEWMHATSQQIFRGHLSLQEIGDVWRELDADQAAGIWVAVAIPENAFELCAQLARRYGPKLGVRTLDSLHVACALELKAERFWTFDERQAKLAKAEGMTTG
jgi:predicted nucleic acid-binding protein